MTILIFEPQLSGHWFNYLRLTASLFTKNGHETALLTLKQHEGNPLLENLMTALGTGFKVYFGTQYKWESGLYAGKKLYNKEFLNYRLIKKLLKSSSRPAQIDLVFIPYLDAMARFLSFTANPFDGIPFAGISMVPAFHYQEMRINAQKPRFPQLGKYLFLRLLKNRHLIRLLTIDQPLSEYTVKFYPELATKIRYIPDPVELGGKSSKEEARGHFGIPQAVKVILVYGSIAERKGVLELLDALAYNNTLEDVVVLVAGVQTEKVRNKIQSQTRWNCLVGKKIFIVDRYLTTEEEYMAFKLSDMVWCGYKGFYAMSAVLIQSAAMGLPVIASREGIVSWLTEKHQIGKIVDVNSKVEIVEAIKDLVENYDEYVRYSKNGLTLSDMHDLSHFNSILLETIQAAR